MRNQFDGRRVCVCAREEESFWINASSMREEQLLIVWCTLYEYVCIYYSFVIIISDRMRADNAIVMPPPSSETPQTAKTTTKARVILCQFCRLSRAARYSSAGSRHHRFCNVLFRTHFDTSLEFWLNDKKKLVNSTSHHIRLISRQKLNMNTRKENANLLIWCPM